tara:strand:- start:34971 stop:35126 length:156 start_codon:yes stop_codon:yes gene_type:complete
MPERYPIYVKVINSFLSQKAPLLCQGVPIGRDVVIVPLLLEPEGIEATQDF